MAKKGYAVCQSCGKRADYTECSEGCAPPDDAEKCRKKYSNLDK